LPDLPHKGDVSDFLSAGGTREALERLAAEAPPWTPGAERTAGPPEAPSPEGAEAVEPLAWQWMADVEAKPIEYLGARRIRRGMPPCTGGEPGAGTSFILCARAPAESLGVVPGEPVRAPEAPGEPAEGPAREPATVVMLFCEDSAAHVTRPRLEAM